MTETTLHENRCVHGHLRHQDVIKSAILVTTWIEGTDVCAMTLHALFDLDGELQSRLDLTNISNEKTKQLISLDVLLLASRRASVEARSV